MGENYENVHGVEARMKNSMFRQVPKPLKIEEKSSDIFQAKISVSIIAYVRKFSNDSISSPHHYHEKAIKIRNSIFNSLNSISLHPSAQYRLALCSLLGGSVPLSEANNPQVSPPGEYERG